MSSPIVSLSNLSVGYNAATPIATNITANLHCGELTCLLGPNGVGKSTLLRTIAKLQPPCSGQINIHNKPISNLTLDDMARTVAVVFTNKTFAGGLTVFDVVALGRQPYTGFFGRLSDVDKQIIFNVLQVVGVDSKHKCFFAELSDGEQQKVLIAKALAQQTPIVILDEPTSFLDVVARIEIFQLLKSLAINEQKAILVATHELDIAIRMASHFWLLNQHFFESGSAAKIINSESLTNLYPSKTVHYDNTLQQFIYNPNKR